MTDIIRKQIDWLHFHVYRNPDQQPAKYEDLSIAEFVFGYLAIANNENNKQTKRTMMDHLEELMEDATQYPWENVRNYHSIVLHHIEMKSLKRQDNDSTQKLRRTYAMRPHVGMTASNSNAMATEI